MKSSESISALSAAIVAAQASSSNAVFDSVNPHYHNRYSSLAEVIGAMKPVLAKAGLAILQWPAHREGGPVLVTRIIHASGEWMEDEYCLNPTKMDPQGFGSAITYARRYVLPGILMIASEEDDDGEAASRPSPVAKPSIATGPTPAATPTAVKQRIDALRPAVMAATSKDALKVIWDGAGVDKSDPVAYMGTLELFNQRIAELKAPAIDQKQ